MITILHTQPADFDERLRALTKGQLNGADQCVTAEDMAYCRRRKQPLDRRRCVAARAALRLVAAERSGTPLADAQSVPISRSCRSCGGDHGQPRTDGISLSSSSTRTGVLAGAAAACADIGVDVETIPEALFSGFDTYALHALEDASDQLRSVRDRVELWVLKEAALKAAGIGLEHPPAELLFGDAGESSTLYCGSGSHQGSWPLEWRPVIESREADVAGLWCCLIPAGTGRTASVAARIPQDIAALDALTGGTVPARPEGL